MKRCRVGSTIIMALGVALMAEGAYAGGHGSDDPTSLDVSGRVRGWFENKSTKANSDAGSVARNTFTADSRLRVVGMTKEGGWTGKAKFEIDIHDASDPSQKVMTTRAAWAELGNESFSVRVGHQRTPHFTGPNQYTPLNNGNGTKIATSGRTDSAVLQLKMVENLDLSFSIIAEIDGEQEGEMRENDVTSYEPYVAYNFGNFKLGAALASTSVAGNDTRGGVTDNTMNSSRASLFFSGEFGGFAPYLGVESETSTSEVVAVDEETGLIIEGELDEATTRTLAGVEYTIAKGMGLAFEYYTWTMSPDEGDDVTKSRTMLGFRKEIANVGASVGYRTESTSSDDESVDGATLDWAVVGLDYNF